MKMAYPQTGEKPTGVPAAFFLFKTGNPACASGRKVRRELDEERAAHAGARGDLAALDAALREARPSSAIFTRD